MLVPLSSAAVEDFVYTFRGSELTCGKLQKLVGPLFNAMRLMPSLTRSCFGPPCRRLRAPLSSWIHVPVRCRPQSGLHASGRGAIALQHGRDMKVSSRQWAHQPRSLLPIQHRLYSVYTSPEPETDNM